MDLMLKAYLTFNPTGDIWVTTEGVIVSGKMTNANEYLPSMIKTFGFNEQDVDHVYPIVMGSAKFKMISESLDSENPMPILFANADVIQGDQLLHKGPVSVDVNKIGAWGPGLIDSRRLSGG